MSLPAAWWAAVHGMAAAVTALLVAWLCTLGFGEPPGLTLRHLTKMIEPLLFTLLLMGALLGLHGRPWRGTWVGLSSLAVLGVALSFLGYVLPLGQVSFALATSPGIASMATLPLLWPLALLAALLWHLTHLWRRRTSGRHLAVAGAALWLVLALAAVLLPVLSPPAPIPPPDPFASVDSIRQSTAAPSLPASPLATPAHILPDPWLLPFYGVLTAVPGKLAGLAALGLSLVVWVALPWLDRHRAAPLWDRPASGIVAAAIGLCLLLLGWIGTLGPGAEIRLVPQLVTTSYFALFLVALPLAARRLPAPPRAG